MYLKVAKFRKRLKIFIEKYFSGKMVNRTMIDTKRARITRALKQFILSSSGAVSRGDVAHALNIDLRTAASYLEDLCNSGLLRCEKFVSGGKGRHHRGGRLNES